MHDEAVGMTWMLWPFWFGTESERIRVRTSTGQNVHGLVETYMGAGENVHGLKAQVQCNVLETYTGTGENVHGLKAQVQCNVLCFILTVTALFPNKSSNIPTRKL